MLISFLGIGSLLCRLLLLVLSLPVLRGILDLVDGYLLIFQAMTTSLSINFQMIEALGRI